MLSPRGLDRSGEGTEYVSGCAVERQKRLALKSPYARVLGYLRAEPEFGDRNWGEKDRLIAG